MVDDFTAVGKVPEIPIILVKTAEIFDSACHFPAQPTAGNTDRFRPDVSDSHTVKHRRERADVCECTSADAITDILHTCLMHALKVSKMQNKDEYWLKHLRR